MEVQGGLNCFYTFELSDSAEVPRISVMFDKNAIVDWKLTPYVYRANLTSNLFAVPEHEYAHVTYSQEYTQMGFELGQN